MSAESDRAERMAERLEDKLHALREPLLPARPSKPRPLVPSVAPGDIPRWDYSQ